VTPRKSAGTSHRRKATPNPVVSARVFILSPANCGGIRGRESQIPFGVMCVVIEPVSDWRAGDSGLEDFRFLQDGQGRHVTAEGPAEDSRAIDIDLTVFASQRFQSSHLVAECHRGKILVNGPLPIPAPPWNAAPINRNHNKSLVCEPLQEQPTRHRGGDVSAASRR